MLVETATIVFLGVFIGVFLRTWLPAYRRKAQMQEEGKAFAFDHKYTATAISGFLISFVVCFMVMPTVNITSDFVASFADGLKVFGSGLLSGFGANALVNELTSTFGA